ncbi:hypothetical protein V7x_45430 [Crateriforma conspicua]|uniref:Uncharacterized protein n=1 Tax=Crateriforma conspicua TaxID=2527996 RepID=A0A5C6FLA6_9PLAN|nr:hypothetical protein V7x_45430 [Crateriforma conspicua]
MAGGMDNDRKRDHVGMQWIWGRRLPTRYGNWAANLSCATFVFSTASLRPRNQFPWNRLPFSLSSVPPVASVPKFVVVWWLRVTD